MATGGWYDLAITVERDSQFEHHVAGHLENGEDSISEPIMGGCPTIETLSHRGRADRPPARCGRRAAGVDRV